MKFLILLFVVSCSSDNTYTDPEQEKLTYYMCEKDHEIVVKHSDDYEKIVIKYGKNQQVTLHHFVAVNGTGYRTENLLWLTKGKLAKLIERKADGSEVVLFNECKAEKLKLQY